MKSVDINGTTLSIENTDRYTTDNRAIFEWRIQLNGETFSEADLKSGCGQEPSEEEMLETLLAFLGAAGEYERYNNGDPDRMFPVPVCKWASENEDEIDSLRFMLKEDRKRAASVRQTAYEWHSGQGSPLYAFASSGICENKEDLLLEISGCLLENHDDEELEELKEFVEGELVQDIDGNWLAPWHGA